MTRTSRKAFPRQVEKPNDDANQGDKSSAPNNDGEYFNIDIPGYRWRPGTIRSNFLIQQFNAYEFLRVRLDGIRPAGNVIRGSRCSPRRSWHTRTLLENFGGNLVRTDGGPDYRNKETESNHIDILHMSLTTPCAAEQSNGAGRPGDSILIPCRIFNLTNARKTYDWAITVRAPDGVIITPRTPTGSTTINSLTLEDVNLRFDIGRNSARGTATVTLTVTERGGERRSCSEEGQIVVR